MPAKITAKIPGKIPNESRDAAPQWRALELLLEAHALLLGHEAAAAGFVMIAAHALGDRLGLPEAVVVLMAESATAEARRSARGRPRRRDR